MELNKIRAGHRVVLIDGTVGICTIGADGVTYFVGRNGIHFSMSDIEKGMAVVEKIYDAPDNPGKLLSITSFGELLWEVDNLSLSDKDKRSLISIMRLFPEYKYLGKGSNERVYIYGGKPTKSVTAWKESDELKKVAIDIERFDMFKFKSKGEMQLFDIMKVVEKHMNPSEWMIEDKELEVSEGFNK